ncbi:MAG: SRPBCC domain-containing protein [Acidobacteria bacterium]|nr:SRPBCC domain-containing protein [Acidobacteriota bacterium]
MQTTEITVTRTIPASPEEVYDVWIDPKSPGGPWFGATKVIVNVAVDGVFYLAVGHEAKMWPHYGRFVKLDRPNVVEHTWMSESTKGLESVVTLTLDRQGAGTLVTLRHSGVPDDEAGRKHKEGWDWVLSMLDQSVTKRKSAVK